MNTIEVANQTQPQSYIQIAVDDATGETKIKIVGKMRRDVIIAAMSRIKFKFEMDQYAEDLQAQMVAQQKAQSERVEVATAIPPVPNFRR